MCRSTITRRRDKTLIQSNETERLQQLAALGDLEALSRLMVEARRRGDPVLLRQTEASLYACARAAVQERAPSRALMALRYLPPSAALWNALCDLLPAFTEQRLAEVIDELSPYLASWPDALREAPRAWWNPKPANAPATTSPPLTPALTLARSLTLRGIESPTELTQITDALPPLAHFTALAIQPAVMSDRTAHHAAVLRIIDLPQMSSLTTLSLDGCALLDEGCERLAALPLLNTVQRLSLARNMLRARAIESLTRAARMRSLKSLDLSRNLLDDDALGALIHGPHLDHLTHLELRDNGLLREQGAQTLARAPSHWQSRLAFLGLARCQINDEGLASLARAPAFSSLEHLDLSSNSISQAGARALCRMDSLTKLHTLNLSDNALRDPSLMSLAHWPSLQRLNWLDLSANQLQPPALSEFCMSRHTSGLRYLDLSANPLGDRGLAVLSTSRQLSGLLTLRLRGCGATDRGISGLFASPLCKRLTSLDLGNVPPGERRHGEQMNRISSATPESLSLLASSDLRLTSLSLAHCPISDAGAFALARSPALSLLTSLDLTGCNLSPQACAAIIRSPIFANLTHLAIRGNTPGAEGASALCNYLPLLDSLDFDPQSFTPDGLNTLRAAPSLNPQLWRALSPA